MWSRWLEQSGRCPRQAALRCFPKSHAVYVVLDSPLVKGSSVFSTADTNRFGHSLMLKAISVVKNSTQPYGVALVWKFTQLPFGPRYCLHHP